MNRGWGGAGPAGGRGSGSKGKGRVGPRQRRGGDRAGAGGQGKAYFTREQGILGYNIFSHQKKATRPIKQGYRGLFLGPALPAGRENALWLNSMPDRAWSLTQGILCPADRAWSNYWPSVALFFEVLAFLLMLGNWGLKLG